MKPMSDQCIIKAFKPEPTRDYRDLIFWGWGIHTIISVRDSTKRMRLRSSQKNNHKKQLN